MGEIVHVLSEDLGRLVVEASWNVVAHGDAREGEWRGNWRMEWVASTLTRPRDVLYPALLTLMRTPRLPAVDWTDSPADLNGLVRLGERRNVVSARVPSGSARASNHDEWVSKRNDSTFDRLFCAFIIEVLVSDVSFRPEARVAE